jgi:hypothetical protein
MTSKETTKSSQALDKVTDYVEDAEVSDEKAHNAAKSFKQVQKRYIYAYNFWIISYKDVKVSDKDVTLLMKELDLDKPAATKLLQRNEANLQKALRAYIHE